MKKYIFIFLTIFFVGFNAFADGESCLISGANDGSSLLIVSSQKVNNIIEVTIANDSQTIAANVTITATVSYNWGTRTTTKESTGAGLAMPSSTTIIKIPIEDKIDNYAFTDYKLSLKSSKCQ